MEKPNLNIAIYVIDDDADQRFVLNVLLRSNHIDNYTIFSDPDELLESLHKGVQICILDYQLNHPDFNGISLMQAIKKQNSYCKCIIISGYEDAAMVKAFLNNGAFRFATKAEENFEHNLVGYIREATEELISAYNFYATVLDRIKETKEQLTSYKNGEINH